MIVNENQIAAHMSGESSIKNFPFASILKPSVRMQAGKKMFCVWDKEPERRVAHFPIHNLFFFSLSFALCCSLLSVFIQFRASSGCEPIIVLYFERVFSSVPFICDAEIHLICLAHLCRRNALGWSSQKRCIFHVSRWCSTSMNLLRSSD